MKRYPWIRPGDSLPDILRALVALAARKFLWLIVIMTALVLLTSLLSCALPKDISNELFDRDKSNILRNTAVEHVVDNNVGGPAGLWIKGEMRRLRDSLDIRLQGDYLLRQPDEGVLLVLPSDRIFQSGRTGLTAEGEALLADIVASAKPFPHLKIHVLVHSDNNSSDYASLALSEARARALKKAFRRLGTKGVNTEGKGDLVPVITNESAEGRRQNRRVEMAFVADKKMKHQARKAVGKPKI